ncbi:hypothetical protein J2S44_005375 [Catenuloplanes niger]|uniref:Uncharacterized protein n=1 Tax=Catenuloplanes niger TaxID=587534 RepID=A0AAE3ZWG4_9ACTN|nr:hypothetical protein [Catenuloplanes niger]
MTFALPATGARPPTTPPAHPGRHTHSSPTNAPHRHRGAPRPSPSTQHRARPPTSQRALPGNQHRAAPGRVGSEPRTLLLRHIPHRTAWPTTDLSCLTQPAQRRTVWPTTDPLLPRHSPQPSTQPTTRRSERSTTNPPCPAPPAPGQACGQPRITVTDRTAPNTVLAAPADGGGPGRRHGSGRRPVPARRSCRSWPAAPAPRRGANGAPAKLSGPPGWPAGACGPHPAGSGKIGVEVARSGSVLAGPCGPDHAGT